MRVYAGGTLHVYFLEWDNFLINKVSDRRAHARRVYASGAAAGRDLVFISLDDCDFHAKSFFCLAPAICFRVCLSLCDMMVRGVNVRMTQSDAKLN